MYGKTMQNVRDDVYKILQSQAKSYYVQIGSYTSKAKAEEMQNALKLLGTNSTVIEQ